MKIRKFTAQNTQDAIAKVKLEMGSEALIINTRKVRQKGLFGAFKKPVFEVTAAIDEQTQARTKRIANHVREYNEKNPASGVNDVSIMGAGGAAIGAERNDVFAQFQTQLKASGMLRGSEAAQASANAAGMANRSAGISAYETAKKPAVDVIYNDALAPPVNPAPATPVEPARDNGGDSGGGDAGNNGGPAAGSGLDLRVAELETQLAGIEMMLNKVYREVSASSKMVEVDDERLAPLTKVLRLFYGNLVRNEVEPEFSLYIIERVNDLLQSENNSFDAATALYNEVISVLGKPSTMEIKRDKKPTVAIFLGPTGVGKTTTLAKIAADYALNKDLDVAMITADTYRIAAVQQLKTYAEILGIPVSVVYTPGEIKKSVAEFSNKDLILIDTAGRSHRNRAQFGELRELVGASGADEIFLVLSMTASVKNNREIIQNYDFLDDYKLIFTKADETPVFGAIVNARMLTGKNLSYVTVGQSVPDDIEVASVEKIARNLIGSVSE